MNWQGLATLVLVLVMGGAALRGMAKMHRGAVSQTHEETMKSLDALENRWVTLNVAIQGLEKSAEIQAASFEKALDRIAKSSEQQTLVLLQVAEWSQALKDSVFLIEGRTKNLDEEYRKHVLADAEIFAGISASLQQLLRTPTKPQRRK